MRRTSLMPDALKQAMKRYRAWSTAAFIGLIVAALSVFLAVLTMAFNLVPQSELAVLESEHAQIDRQIRNVRIFEEKLTAINRNVSMVHRLVDMEIPSNVVVFELLRSIPQEVTIDRMDVSFVTRGIARTVLQARADRMETIAAFYENLYENPFVKGVYIRSVDEVGTMDTSGALRFSFEIDIEGGGS